MASVSRSVFVTIVLGLGILLMLIFNPPYSVCDAEVEEFKRREASFLFKQKSKFKESSRSMAVVLKEQCLRTNSPGGCFEYFTQLKLLLRDLDQVSSQCRADVGGISQLKKVFWDSTGLIVNIAWTDKPPEAAFDKLAWLTVSDLNLYCHFKRLSHDYYGKQQWESFQEKMMTTLPGADKLSRSQVWSLSVLSENCSSYL